jgi:hypothetical protein
MAKRGRPPLVVPTVEWKCRVPIDIAAQVDLILYDPVRNITAYGERSALVGKLLKEWLVSQKIHHEGVLPC